MTWGHWPRWTEIGLGLWLIASPWTVGGTLLLDSLTGMGVVLLAALSLKAKSRLHYLHLVELALAVLLLGFGYALSFPEPTPATQNRIIMALLIVMFAIIPHSATEPPSAWSKILRSSPP